MVALALALAFAAFKNFKTKHNKVYNHDDADAKATFQAHMQHVEDHNALNLGIELGEDRFSSLTQEQ